MKKGAAVGRDAEGNEVQVEPDESGETVSYVFKTLADPFAGRINLFRVYGGIVKHDSQLTNARARTKERLGQLLMPQGEEKKHAEEFGPGDIRPGGNLKETHPRVPPASEDSAISLPPPGRPRAGRGLSRGAK